MKNFVVIVFIPFLPALISTVLLNGQTLSPQVVVTTGADFSNGNENVAWTVGQIAIATLSNSDYRFTQGFQQSYLTVTPVANQILPPEILIYPNPTGHFLNVELLKNFDENVTLVLSDFNGRTLLEKERAASDFLLELDLSGLPDAMYLLTIRQNSSGQTSSFKITKTNVR